MNLLLFNWVYDSCFIFSSINGNQFISDANMLIFPKSIAGLNALFLVLQQAGWNNYRRFWSANASTFLFLIFFWFVITWCKLLIKFWMKLFIHTVTVWSDHIKDEGSYFGRDKQFHLFLVNFWMENSWIIYALQLCNLKQKQWG